MRRKKRIDINYKEKDELILRNLKSALSLNHVNFKDFPDLLIIPQLYSDTKLYEDILTLIRNLEFKQFEVREYTSGELNKSSYFDAVFYYPWEHDDYDPKENRTLYDNRNRCPVCGRVEYQLTELLLNATKMAKHHIVYNYPDILVTSFTKEIIEDQQLTGCSFRKVTDCSKHEKKDIYQLIINNYLDKMDMEKTATDKHQYCEKCLRGAVLRSEIFYDIDSLKNATDFNYSKEYFGFGVYCSPRVIVSSKVRNIFKEKGIRVQSYKPITIVNYCNEE
ncbi:hypothetical protein ACFO9Q_09800 [Paenibacillus sp. GCM10023252]|uniref:hypothetical protein n=1 Tax=Paenibacillus sp. GCM10023252 TaxID=3252649 RepID=UPI003605CB65